MNPTHWRHKFLRDKPEGSYLTTKQIALKADVSEKKMAQLIAKPENQFPKAEIHDGVFFYQASLVDAWLETHDCRQLVGRSKPVRVPTPQIIDNPIMLFQRAAKTGKIHHARRD
jgi:hypothetical protein